MKRLTITKRDDGIKLKARIYEDYALVRVTWGNEYTAIRLTRGEARKLAQLLTEFAEQKEVKRGK